MFKSSVFILNNCVSEVYIYIETDIPFLDILRHYTLHDSLSSFHRSMVIAVGICRISVCAESGHSLHASELKCVVSVQV